jgi:hypothetical protein
MFRIASQFSDIPSGLACVAERRGPIYSAPILKKKFLVRPRNRSDCRISGVVHLIFALERIVAVRPRGFGGEWSWNRRAA